MLAIPLVSIVVPPTNVQGPQKSRTVPQNRVSLNSQMRKNEIIDRTATGNQLIVLNVIIGF